MVCSNWLCHNLLQLYHIVYQMSPFFLPFTTFIGPYGQIFLLFFKKAIPMCKKDKRHTHTHTRQQELYVLFRATVIIFISGQVMSISAKQYAMHLVCFIWWWWQTQMIIRPFPIHSITHTHTCAEKKIERKRLKIIRFLNQNTEKKNKNMWMMWIF